VGLVAASVFAELGHHVDVVEIDPERRNSLVDGRVPFFEPGLQEALADGLGRGRLRVVAKVERADLYFLAVGTPAAVEGADLSALLLAAQQVRAVDPRGLLVIKSTVPVGTADQLACTLSMATVSNPEFLAEGTALDNFRRPERVVLGGPEADVERVARLYAPLEAPIVRTTRRSAEASKYAANLFLAARVSLVNEVARWCSASGADVEVVRRVVGADPRIGANYLRPGLGYGGSCLPKDVRAIMVHAESLGLDMPMTAGVRAVNALQFRWAAERLRGLPAGSTVALWGVSFKPGTDDTRESPGLAFAAQANAMGWNVVAHDPRARSDAFLMTSDQYSALEGASALVVATEWPTYRSPDWDRVAQAMVGRIVVDGRNLYDPVELRARGFTVHSVGRPGT